jgi:hypothetical protein
VIANLVRALIVFLLLFVQVSPVSSSAQTVARHGPAAQTPAEDESRVRMEKDMAKKANEQRQADLKRDTDKLLKLTTELKDYVDKTNENLLSVEVMNKAEEIEKLAHSVREKMRGNN